VGLPRLGLLRALCPAGASSWFGAGVSLAGGAACGDVGGLGGAISPCVESIAGFVGLGLSESVGSATAGIVPMAVHSPEGQHCRKDAGACTGERQRVTPQTQTTAADFCNANQLTLPTKHRNPVFKRHRTNKIFRTLNQARVIWDPLSKVKGLFGGHLNIRSMKPKREQLEHLLCSSNIDFLGLSETWLTHSSPEAVVNMPGYNVFRKDRNNGRGGGVIMYVRNTLKCTMIEWPSEIVLECVGVDISLSATMSFVIVCIYRKPTAKNDFYEQLKLLLNHCDKTKEIILMGDFNINWNVKRERTTLKHITDYFNLTQMIKTPTRITNHSETLIDLLFTNHAERIGKTYNLITGLSDHNIVFVSRK
jgi:exonuclease III